MLAGPQQDSEGCSEECTALEKAAPDAMSRSREPKVVAAASAAILASAGLSYYVSDQWMQRYPRYQEQAALFSEVGDRNRCKQS